MAPWAPRRPPWLGGLNRQHVGTTPNHEQGTRSVINDESLADTPQNLARDRQGTGIPPLTMVGLKVSHRPWPPHPLKRPPRWEFGALDRRLCDPGRRGDDDGQCVQLRGVGDGPGAGRGTGLTEEVKKVRKSVRDGKGLKEVDFRTKIEGKGREVGEGKW